MNNFKIGSAFKVAKRNDKDNLINSLNSFNIPTESWDEAAYYRAMWCCLIRKRTAIYEEMSVREAERKRK